VTTFSAGTKKQKPQAPRPTRSLQKAQGARRRCSAAGHSAKAYVTGCKATIGVCHMPCFVLIGAPCKGQGAPSRRPFQSGRKSNKEAPDTPLRYVTGFNTILIKSR
jgi:hypothetical protein